MHEVGKNSDIRMNQLNTLSRLSFSLKTLFFLYAPTDRKKSILVRRCGH